MKNFSHHPQHSMDWFKGKTFSPESPMILMGKSMGSGFEFSQETNPLKHRSIEATSLCDLAGPCAHSARECL
jgi:hypothetical protein